MTELDDVLDAPAPVADAAPTPAPAPEPAEPAAEPSEDDVLDQIWAKHNPTRDASGRFASANPEAAAEGEPAAEETTDQPAKAEGEQAEPAIPAPNSWSADMKAKWPALPPDMQQHIAARESEAHQQISRMGQELASVKPLADLATQYRPVFDHHGLAPTDGIARLLDVQVQLDRDPAGTVARIAQAYGVDLASLVQPADGTQGQADPQVARLQQTVQQLQQQLSSVQQAEEARQHERQQSIARSAAQEVETWAKGKEHFSNPAVRQLMANFVMEGRPMDDAFEAACWAVPEVRQQLLAAQQAKTAETEAKRLADARRAGVLNGGRRAPPPAGPALDEDAQLEAIWQRHHG